MRDAWMLFVALIVCALAHTEEPAPLWQIGVLDKDDREFALAPGGYNDFAADGFFIVGPSDAKKDWPYVHPGPTDDWAGLVPHTFTIAFALDAAPTAEGKFTVALVDTQGKLPPKLSIKINEKAFSQQTPPGAGDASVFGDPKKGKPYSFDVPVAADLLKAGVNTILITSEEGSWVLYDCVALYAPGAKLGKVPEGAVKRPPAPKRAGPLEEVVIVFKTHFDIGYTALAKEVVQRYRTTMMDQALKVCDASKGLPPEQQFAWTIPGWPMAKILEEGPGQTPERIQRIKDEIKGGHFVVHGLPFTTHTETLETEELVRGMGFAAKISRALSLPLPRDAKMTDVASHCWILPTLLKNAGIEFLHLGCNAACRSPHVPPLFWWEGPDGSRVLTMYTAEGYGTGLVPPKSWKYPVWLALIHTGDNHGPPTPAEAKRELDQAAVKLPGVKVRIGRLSDFSDALLKHQPEIPVVRGDMPDTWIHGLLADPGGAAIARNTRPLLPVADALQTNLRIWGVTAGTEAGATALATAYEKSLLYGEHTWGGAQYWITSYGKGKTKFGYGEQWKTEREAGRFKRLEESWAEHTNYIETARDLVAPMISGGMEGLAKATGAEKSNIEGSGRVVIYNPLPWARSGLVTLKAALPKGANTLGDLPADSNNDTTRYVALNLPPNGYRVYAPGGADYKPPDFEIDEAKGTLGWKHFKATLDPARCCVKSLVANGRELIDANSPYGFGQYLYERFDVENTKNFLNAYVKIKADWADNEIGKPNMPTKEQAPYAAASPSGGTLKIEKGLCAITAVMAAPAGGNIKHAITSKLTLYDKLPYADFEITLHDKPADPWPEAGWICFPFKIEEPQFKLGRLGAIVDPAKDCIEGCNNEMFWINSGLAVLDAKNAGVGFCPLDHPLISLGQPGLWRYTQQFTPRKPAVFVNLFNNQWTTNFRMWNSGTWTSRVRIWAIDKYDANESLITPCLEARNPPLAAYTDAPAGKLPATQNGLELSRKGVALTAFGPNPDGEGTLLRLWEMAGDGKACRVKLPAGMKITSAQPCDLRGQTKGQPIPIIDGAMEVPLGAFGPYSVILK
ncbi:MAG TPA: polysaccharide lyase family protein [Planctomycetota bacterium]|jgi:hypothetical protein